MSWTRFGLPASMLSFQEVALSAWLETFAFPGARTRANTSSCRCMHRFKSIAGVSGFNNLAPIIWHKIANAVFEASGNGGGFLGKPYEPNSVIKNDIEFILMERKPGGYRSPSLATRILSVIPADHHKTWFQQIWTGLTGASTKLHPAPYPLQLAERLIRMFSFVGDTVLDPFMGTGTTNIAAAKWGRNSVGVEVDPHYFDMAAKRLDTETPKLIARREIRFHQ